MNVFFVVTNTKRKSLVFITEKLEVLSLTEMVTAVKNHLFEKLYIVTGTSGTYIRSTPDQSGKNNIDAFKLIESKQFQNGGVLLKYEVVKN